MAPEGRGGLFGRLFYYTAFFLIVVGVAKFYLIWLENYRLLHPEVIEALAAGYIEEQPLEGILLLYFQVAAYFRQVFFSDL